MFNKQEQFAEVTGQAVDAALTVANTSLESIEKIASLNLESSRKFLTETSKAFRELSTLNTPKDFFERFNQLATTTVENQICNCRDIYEIVSSAQAKVGKLFENQLSMVNQNVNQAVDNLSQFGSSSTSGDSVKSWINSATQAVNTATKMASQITEFANNNIKSATTATVDAVKKTVKK